MKLWRFELKKLLFTQKGLLILAVCMLLKAIAFGAVPEMKDDRIKLSQKQYDKYLAQLYGENTSKKSEFIIGEYQNCKNVQAMQEGMENGYRAGEITEDEWNVYCKELDEAYLHENAAKIFSDKAETFLKQDASLPPAHYIYEYGWQTVFTLHLIPDIFLLFGVLLLTAQCFSTEMTGGMLPILLAARNGRRQLFLGKLTALLTTCMGGIFVSDVLEVGIFHIRGFLNDGYAPLYSITLFAKDCALDVTLWQGYLLSLGVGGCATLLLAGMFFGISVWIRNTTNLMFVAVSVLVAPLLLLSGMKEILFAHTGLVTGSKMLQVLGESGIPVMLPLGVVGLYSVGVVVLAMRRYQRGL